MFYYESIGLHQNFKVMNTNSDIALVKCNTYTY